MFFRLEEGNCTIKARVRQVRKVPGTCDGTEQGNRPKAGGQGSSSAAPSPNKRPAAQCQCEEEGTCDEEGDSEVTSNEDSDGSNDADEAAGDSEEEADDGDHGDPPAKKPKLNQFSDSDFSPIQAFDDGIWDF